MSCYIRTYNSIYTVKLHSARIWLRRTRSLVIVELTRVKTLTPGPKTPVIEFPVGSFAFSAENACFKYGGMILYRARGDDDRYFKK